MQEKYPKIGIITPIYNIKDREGLLERAVKSVAKQKYKGKINHYIVDDYSDGAVEINTIAKYRDIIAGENKSIIITVNNRKKGRSGARNTGILRALEDGCEYIGFLDSDDWLLKNHVKLLVENIGDSIACYSNAMAYNGIQRVQVYGEDFDYTKIQYTNYIPNLCFLIKAEFFKENLFDEEIFLLEDWDMWIRLAQKGNISHICNKTAIYRWGEGTSTNKHTNDFWKYRLYVLHKHMNRWKNNTDVRKNVYQIVLDIQRSDVYRQCVYDMYSNEYVEKWYKYADGLMRELGIIHYSLKDMIGNEDKKYTDLSVIILTCGNLEYTQQCISSILRGTDRQKLNYEIIVVDNGSKDNTIEYMQELIAGYAFIKLIINRHNEGYARGNNVGLSVIDRYSKHILLLNNDTVVPYGNLEKMIDQFKKSKLDIAGAVADNISGAQRVDLIGDKKDIGYNEMSDICASYFEQKEGKVKPVHKLTGFCLLFSREVLNTLGGLDERFGLGNWEDDDYCVRARIEEFKIGILESIYVWHYGSKTFKSEKIDYSKSITLNRKKFMSKWGLNSNIKDKEVMEELIKLQKDYYIRGLRKRFKGRIKINLQAIEANYHNNVWFKKHLYTSRLDKQLSKDVSPDDLQYIVKIVTNLSKNKEIRVKTLHDLYQRFGSEDLLRMLQKESEKV